ncbi:hypothetical protein NliqN6_6823 [Naganishia liquefaciens]|uniref:Kinase n=1 Tax=Naganishia liquefaciens TaxID=104408 RepID=A0A8H3TZA2_9TREE|nr:hypothetical protein NliqN6_6823 [Naganishia liquefaciens]
MLHQIGGHPSVTTDESGSLLIKTAAPREIAFYQLLHSTPAGRCAADAPHADDDDDDDDDDEIPSWETLLGGLKRFVPRFWGTLAVHDVALTRTTTPTAPQQDAIVLSNLTHRYVRPNVMDIKLGTVLYDAADPSVTAGKREKMERKARERSVALTGAAITGYQTWDNTQQQYIRGERSACGLLPPSALPHAFTCFTPTPTPSLLRTLRHLLTTLSTLARLLAHLEIRLIGSSLLIIYEGDPTLHDNAWTTADHVGATPDGLEEEQIHHDDDGPCDPSSSSSSSSAASTIVAPPFTLRLIDFAHTRLCEGDGPDRGVLKGLETVMGLVKGRIEEVERQV